MTTDSKEAVLTATSTCNTASCGSTVAEALNQGCFCVSLDSGVLRAALQSTLKPPSTPQEPDLFALIEQRCPYVFSANPVFISRSHVRQMEQLVQAIESVADLPAYRTQVLAGAPEIARQAPNAAKGVFYGYDFHLHEESIALIEVNTNAGGAMLNAALARAQRACCDAVENMLPALDAAQLESRIVEMFRNEWRLGGQSRPLQTIAIVDEQPSEQYLFPEFLMFQQLFRSHGLEALIADPGQLVFRDGALWHGATRVDLVYNRLTDFMLEAPSSAAISAAYAANAVVLTPHPQAHALFANKRNLALLTDPVRLDALGVARPVQEILLSGIPRTEIVDPAQGERLWAERRKLFFKPAAGYGSRAAYRGDKLTRRVWEEILAGDYIAQAIVAPAERSTGPDAAAQRLKFDIRAYAYDGAIQWLAARLYQGQTTNFRTPGGGFAPVYCLDL
ncbi:hypothetical protein EKL02_10150 [Janthinobacterium sp. 17J80-10]|nr:hypothetical protein EKL02_10150 [Janthinobacterium sp. 17J80-10]